VLEAQEEERGETFPRAHSGQPLFSHGRPFRFVVRLFEGKRRRRKASFMFQGLEGNLKKDEEE
jgi:hypothetical protein